MMKFVTGTALVFLMASIFVTITSATASGDGDLDRVHEEGVTPTSTLEEIKKARIEFESLRSSIALAMSAEAEINRARMIAKERALARAGLAVLDITNKGEAVNAFFKDKPVVDPETHLVAEISSVPYQHGRIAVFKVAAAEEAAREFAPAEGAAPMHDALPAAEGP